MSNEYNISNAFQRIEERLIKSMKKNLTRHLNEERDLDMNWSAWQSEQLKSLEKFRRENRTLFKNDFNTINYDVEEFIKQSFENGKLDQERMILQSIQDGTFETNNKQISKLWHIYKTSNNRRIKKKQLTRIFDKVNNAESSFFKVNENKLKDLINETTGNLREVESSILRYTNDQYRKIIYDAQVFANTGAGTPQQAIDMATQDFLSKGINNIEYANGRMVNIASYVEMAIRTANIRATLYGEGLKRDEWGIHTVLIPNRGGGCPKCVKFQGKVYIDDVYSNGTAAESNETGYPLLSTIIKQGFLHPNCKDTFLTYFPEINSEVHPPTAEQVEAKRIRYNKEQKLNYIDRNIEKYKRLELGSIDAENIDKYHRKRLEWQEYKKKFKANSDLTFNEMTNAKKSDIILLPNHEKAIIPKEKLVDYALNMQHPIGKDKAIAFEKALGYNQSNYEKLIDNVKRNIPNYNAVHKGSNEYGEKYEILMTLFGENKKYANVKTGWIVEKETNQTKLTSLYVTSRKWKEGQK